MYIEERIANLEEENRQLREMIEPLVKYEYTRYVTPAELAEIMHCTVQTVHRKIKIGEVRATLKLGDPRIPLCQFTEGLDEWKKICVMSRKSAAEMSMEDRIFG